MYANQEIFIKIMIYRPFGDIFKSGKSSMIRQNRSFFGGIHMQGKNEERIKQI